MSSREHLEFVESIRRLMTKDSVRDEDENANETRVEEPENNDDYRVSGYSESLNAHYGSFPREEEDTISTFVSTPQRSNRAVRLDSVASHEEVDQYNESYGDDERFEDGVEGGFVMIFWDFENIQMSGADEQRHAFRSIHDRFSKAGMETAFYVYTSAELDIKNPILLDALPSDSSEKIVVRTGGRKEVVDTAISTDVFFRVAELYKEWDPRTIEIHVYLVTNDRGFSRVVRRCQQLDAAATIVCARPSTFGPDIPAVAFSELDDSSTGTSEEDSQQSFASSDPPVSAVKEPPEVWLKRALDNPSGGQVHKIFGLNTPGAFAVRYSNLVSDLRKSKLHKDSPVKASKFYRYLIDRQVLAGACRYVFWHVTEPGVAYSERDYIRTFGANPDSSFRAVMKS